MGLFDLLSPGLTRLDGWLAVGMPPLARVLLWGVVCAALSTGIYVKLSPQRRLERLHEVSAKARRALTRYDGPFAGARHRIRRLLILSGLRVGLTLGPALLSALPVLLVFGWVGTAYNHRLPAAGSAVSVRVAPRSVELSWSPSAPRQPLPGQWEVAWPTAGQPIRASDRAGATLIELPLTTPVPVVHKRRWHNRLFGNPSGYLPEDSPVQWIEVGLPRTSLLPLGPPWLRSAEAAYLLALLLASAALRLAWRVR